jgi:hypothetical protein
MIVASWWNIDHTSPSSVSFLIFAGLWTILLAIPYLTITPRFFPTAAHKFGILGVEAVTMLFWLAGFLAEAVWMSHLSFCRGSVCVSARAGVAFSAMTWMSFVATTIMAVVYVFRTKNTTQGSRARKQRFEGMDI